MDPTAYNTYSEMISSVNSVDYECDIPGLLSYIDDCRDNDFQDYLKQFGIQLRKVKINGNNINISYIPMQSTVSIEFIRRIVKNYLNKNSLNIRMSLLCNMPDKDEEQIKNCVLSSSNYEATIYKSNSTDTIWYVGNDLCYDAVIRELSSKFGSLFTFQNVFDNQSRSSHGFFEGDAESSSELYPNPNKLSFQPYYQDNKQSSFLSSDLSAPMQSLSHTNSYVDIAQGPSRSTPKPRYAASEKLSMSSWPRQCNSSLDSSLYFSQHIPSKSSYLSSSESKYPFATSSTLSPLDSNFNSEPICLTELQSYRNSNLNQDGLDSRRHYPNSASILSSSSYERPITHISPNSSSMAMTSSAPSFEPYKASKSPIAPIASIASKSSMTPIASIASMTSTYKVQSSPTPLAKSSTSVPRLQSISVSTDENLSITSIFNPLQQKYAFKQSLNVPYHPNPLYSILTNVSTGTRISIGNNSEYVEFILAFHYCEFSDELKKLNIYSEGYYINDHGFFIVVPSSMSDVNLDSVIAKIVNTSLKDLLKSQRVRFALDDEHFINYLIYVAERFKNRAVVHRINSESICFVGYEAEVRILCKEAKKLEEEEIKKMPLRSNQQIEEILHSYEDCLEPTCSVTGNELQQIWKQGYAPRQLDSGDIAFDCYITRCCRQMLMNYVYNLLSAGGTVEISYIIRCTDYYYLVFKANTAPSRDRWKKYKGKVSAEGMNIQISKLPLHIKPGITYESVRHRIEAISQKQATLCIDHNIPYIVGEESYMHANRNLFNSLSF